MLKKPYNILLIWVNKQVKFKEFTIIKGFVVRFNISSTQPAVQPVFAYSTILTSDLPDVNTTLTKDIRLTNGQVIGNFTCKYFL